MTTLLQGDCLDVLVWGLLKNAYKNRKEVKEMIDRGVNESESVFAVPCHKALIIDEADAGILLQKNSACLDALRRVRAAEAKAGNLARVEHLTGQIQRIEMRNAKNAAGIV